MRVVQGVGAALLVPTSLGLIAELFTNSASRSKAMGVLGGLGGIGAACGPIVGGLLVNWFGWRSIFLINVPIGLLGLALTFYAVRITEHSRRLRLDLPAQIACIASTGSLTVACLKASTWGVRSPAFLAACLVAAAAAGVFVWVERHTQQPMVPLDLF